MESEEIADYIERCLPMDDWALRINMENLVTLIRSIDAKQLTKPNNERTS